ncbi:DUF2007 domain-containing protein [Flavihumibacter sp. R14]|nr:DUF2007 domain-containing protein [Flavihumibacter soli]
MEKENDIKLIEVFAGELWQSTMIQNILEDNQIQVSLENELMGTIAPWRVVASGFNPVKVIVSSSDYEQAVKLIQEYNSSEPLEDEESEEI